MYFNRCSKYFPETENGEAGDTATKKGIRNAQMHIYVHTQKDLVKTRKFSAFTPQLSSSFREFTVFICWEFPDVLRQINKNPLSLCAPSCNSRRRSLPRSGWQTTDFFPSPSAPQVARAQPWDQRPPRAACAPRRHRLCLDRCLRAASSAPSQRGAPSRSGMTLGLPSPGQSGGPGGRWPAGGRTCGSSVRGGCRRTPRPACGYVTAVPAGASPRARTYLGLRPAPRLSPGKGEAPGFFPPSSGSGREPRWDREQRRRGTGYCLQAGGHLSSPSSCRHPVTKDSGPGRSFLLPRVPSAPGGDLPVLLPQGSTVQSGRPGELSRAGPARTRVPSARSPRCQPGSADRGELRGYFLTAETGRRRAEGGAARARREL